MVESRVRMPRKNTERSWDKNHGADDTGGYTHMYYIYIYMAMDQYLLIPFLGG